MTVILQSVGTLIYIIELLVDVDNQDHISKTNFLKFLTQETLFMIKETCGSSCNIQTGDPNEPKFGVQRYVVSIYPWNSHIQFYVLKFFILFTIKRSYEYFSTDIKLCISNENLSLNCSIKVNCLFSPVRDRFTVYLHINVHFKSNICKCFQ